VLRHHREHSRFFATAHVSVSPIRGGAAGGASKQQLEEEDDDDAEALLLLDEGVEETEGGAMHPKAEELLHAHLAKADHAGYQRMQVRWGWWGFGVVWVWLLGRVVWC
jgi:hypothetical protein